jgi:hypothetical protein
MEPMYPEHPDLETALRSSLLGGITYIAGMNAHFHHDTMKCTREANEAEKRLDAEDITTGRDLQSCYRSLVRAFFAQVEGTTYLMRQVVVWAHTRGECTLSPEEALLVREEAPKYNLQRKRVETSERPNHLLENVVLSITLLARAFCAAYSLPLSAHGWEHFQKAVKRRNKITHPKSLNDIFITHDDMMSFRQAVIWFSASVGDLMEACKQAYAKRLGIPAPPPKPSLQRKSLG